MHLDLNNEVCIYMDTQRLIIIIVIIIIVIISIIIIVIIIIVIVVVVVGITIRTNLLTEIHAPCPMTRLWAW